MSKLNASSIVTKSRHQSEWLTASALAGIRRPAAPPGHVGNLKAVIPRGHKTFGSLGSPCQCVGNSLPLAQRMVLLKEHGAILSVNPDKELCNPFPGQPGLNVDEQAIRQSFLMAATMQLAIGPVPKPRSAIAHLSVTLVIRPPNPSRSINAYMPKGRLSKVCQRVNSLFHSPREVPHGQSR